MALTALSAKDYGNQGQATIVFRNEVDVAALLETTELSLNI